MYSASLGRFLQRDPAGYVDGMCLYAYVKNNPLKYLDAWGLSAMDYAKASVEQVVLGNYTDKVNVGGTATQVGLALIGIDLPMDIRDLYHDFDNWKWTWGHIATTGLDGIGLVPVVGVVKNAVRGVFNNKGSEAVLARGFKYAAYIDGTKGISGRLDKNGMLFFTVEKGANTPRGGQMFNEMMKACGSKVVRIQGYWSGGGKRPDNYIAFRAAISKGVSEEDAAFSTFTGKMAKKHGFTKVKITENSSIYKLVKVEFYK